MIIIIDLESLPETPILYTTSIPVPRLVAKTWSSCIVIDIIIIEIIIIVEIIVIVEIIIIVEISIIIIIIFIIITWTRISAP